MKPGRLGIVPESSYFYRSELDAIQNKNVYLTHCSSNMKKRGPGELLTIAISIRERPFLTEVVHSIYGLVWIRRRDEHSWFEQPSGQELAKSKSVQARINPYNFLRR